MEVCRLAIALKCVWSNLAALRYGRYRYSSRDVRLRDRFASIRTTVQIGFDSPNGRHFVVATLGASSLSRRINYTDNRARRVPFRNE